MNKRKNFFQMLTDDYEKEQEELRDWIELLKEKIEKQEDQVENVDRFILTAKKYLHLEKLTMTIPNDTGTECGEQLITI